MREVLDRLEANDRARGPKGLIDDLPLFAASAKPEPPEPKVEAALAALDEIDADAISPRQAQEVLYRLKALRREGYAAGGKP